MTTKSPSLEERFALHKEASAKIKDTVQSWGLKLVRYECIRLPPALL